MSCVFNSLAAHLLYLVGNLPLISSCLLQRSRRAAASPSDSWRACWFARSGAPYGSPRTSTTCWKPYSTTTTAKRTTFFAVPFASARLGSVEGFVLPFWASRRVTTTHDTFSWWASATNAHEAKRKAWQNTGCTPWYTYAKTPRSSKRFSDHRHPVQTIPSCWITTRNPENTSSRRSQSASLRMWSRCILGAQWEELIKIRRSRFRSTSTISRQW